MLKPNSKVLIKLSPQPLVSETWQLKNYHNHWRMQY